MATNAKDAVEYAHRARRVGWRVEEASSGGYKIYNPDNKMYPIHSSISDQKAILAIESNLKRMGLFDAEAEYERKKKAEGRARTAAAQKKADAQIAAANAQQALIAKAAGPYLVECEEPPLDWYLTPHPAPMFKWVNMTPAIAQAILDQANDNNRSLRPHAVDKYRDIILSGQWHLTHQGAAMDEDGNLQDSQHRLTAIVAAGKVEPDLKVPMPFFVGMARENFKAIDEGLLRTAAQLFGKGGEKNTTTLQTLIRVVHAYRADEPRSAMRIRLTNQQILDTFAEDPDRLREAAAYGSSNHKKSLATTGSLSAAYYLINKANGFGNTYVKAFFDGIVNGQRGELALADGDPRKALRSRLLSMRTSGDMKKTTALDLLAMYIQCWNSVAKGHSLYQFRYDPHGPMPRPLICREGEGSCPRALQGEV